MTGVLPFLFLFTIITIIHTHGRTLITIIHKHIRRDATTFDHTRYTNSRRRLPTRSVTQW